MSVRARLAATATVLRALLAALVIGAAALAYRAGTGRADRPPLLGILTVTVLAALVLGWAREWVERTAGRLVLGARADSHAALEDLLATMAGSLPVDEVVVRLAEAAGRHRQRAEVRVWLADGTVWGQAWPPLSPDVGPAYRVDVQHHGDTIGEISVAAEAEPLSPYDRRLLDELAAPAGVALSTVRLSVDLQRREAELQEVNRALAASSARMRDARQRERQRMRAEVNQKVVPHIRAARALLAEEAVDPGAVRLEASRALDELRTIARGIHPARLLEDGLPASLDGWTERTGRPVTVAGRLPDGLDDELVRCAYFCAVLVLDALAVAGGTALGLTLDADDGDVVLEVSGRLGRDAPVEPLPVQLVRDRVEAFGGSLETSTGPGSVTYRCRLPRTASLVAS